jgi:hypothetical protein
MGMFLQFREIYLPRHVICRTMLPVHGSFHFGRQLATKELIIYDICQKSINIY